MRDGDAIKIAFKPGMIKIIGEVSSPGTYKFYRNKRVDYFLSISGGLTPDADLKHIWITYPNGKSKKWSRWLSNPKVTDGSIINIGKKRKRKNL